MGLRILIIGGYGTFGSRLAQLLNEAEGLTLVIGGRSLRAATAFCESLAPGAPTEPLAFDRDGDVRALLHNARADLVIDAAGPFQNYGDNPYRIARAAIEAGIHYIDLADGSNFVREIVSLDELAKSHGVFALAGLSTCPALTGAVVHRLAADLESVDVIHAGIAPSPFAGVGSNVIRAIAAYAGRPIKLWREGRVRVGYGLIDTKRYVISPPGDLPLACRTFSLVEVPDLRLFGESWPYAKTVWVGAGPVPGSLHALVRCLARFVKWRVVKSLAPYARFMFRAVNKLRWGEHRGGMFVSVVGRRIDGRVVERSWHLVAERDDGPWIPAMAAAALVRRLARGVAIEPGARPATDEIPLEEFEPMFGTRQIFCGERRELEGGSQSLYHRVLNNAFSRLPPALVELHADKSTFIASGTATVRRGRGLIARLLATVFGFPASAESVGVKVNIERNDVGELWTREFDGKRFSSWQFQGRRADENLLCERFGPFTFGLALVVDGRQLRYVVRGWQFLGVPLPRWLAPHGNTHEFEDEGQFNFHVEIRAPLIGLIVSYVGCLSPCQ